MSSPLVITGYDPIRLDGTIDSSNALQLEHGSNSLGDHSQSLNAEHEALSSPTATVRVKLTDFTHGGDDWEITASHEDGGTAVTWSRDTDHAYRDFAAMTDAVEIDVVATSDATPPITKTRKIWVKTLPVDAQPDRP